MNLGTRVPDSSSSYFMGSSFCFDETKWTQEENKRFEDALALFDKETPDRWHNVARLIPGKTVIDVVNHYRKLEQDVSHIEAGVFNDPEELEWVANDINHQQFYCHGGKRCQSNRVHDHEKKKGIPWTEEEHRQFLLGLKKYGKGDWRNISRNFVTTRTPTQVASHAQKYFIRQLSGGKDKRRSSIHDITTVHLNDTTKTNQFHEEPKLGDQCNTIPPQKPPHHHIAEARYQWSHLDQQVAANMAFNLPMVAPLHGSSSYVPQYGHLF